ncbi:MAG: tetratricopeptide repeat protein [Acidobacteria bacterium]|nr:tetratricopeptide repeat protein [Acidobacteriota bacterium]
MKRSERHHLKENELVMSLARTRERFEEHRRVVTATIIAVLVILVGGGAWWIWQQRVQTQSAELLANAMATLQARVVPPAPATSTPAPPQPAGTYPSEQAKLQAALPKFLKVADAYPTSQAGIAARYHAAAILASLDRTREAEQRYREVIDRAGSTIYGEMGRMGLADVQARAGKYDQAIQAWKDMASRPQADLPIDGILMQLGRTYQLAGRTTEALQTYRRIVDEFPESQYVPEARQEIDALKGGTSG